MNRSESKYFNTAARMDEAFLRLLEQKEFAYITVKEICQEAGVNRSTFYLHYETMGDLLAESTEHIIRQFRDYMEKDSEAFIKKLRDCPLEELYLVTPEYLTPYLNYIKEHRKVYRTALENAEVLQLEDNYSNLLQYVLLPILERYHVPEKDRRYMLAFHIHGLMAIVTEWLKRDCSDPVEQIVRIMEGCVVR